MSMRSLGSGVGGGATHAGLRRPRRGLRAFAAAAGLSVMAWAAAAPAQVMPLKPVEVRTTVDPVEFTARSLTRLALLDLRVMSSPSPGDFAIADAILAQAQRLAPTDTDILRRRIEASFNAGDERTMIECTRRLLELDPEDTVAQLRLISARIASIQNVEDRLKAYDALLGQTTALDESVRSRLALDAALLRRERGDEAGFVAGLKQACSLDPTNKDAALLALTFFSARVDDRVGRLDLLGNMLLADPIEPRTLKDIRDELAAGGAYKGAWRFHKMLTSLREQAGLAHDDLFAMEGFILQWMNKGPGDVVDELTQRVNAERHRIRFATEASQREGLTPGVSADDARLGVGFEQVRVFAALTKGPEGQADLTAAVTDLSKTIADSAQQVMDPTRRPPNITAERAVEIARNVSADLQMVRYLTGVNAGEGAKDFDVVLQGLPSNDPMRVTVEAWGLLSQRAPEKALARLAEVPDVRSAWHLLAQAACNEQMGLIDEAARRYGVVAESYPLTPIGAFAASRAKVLRAESTRSRSASELEAWAEKVPSWIDEMPSKPRLTQQVQADLVKLRCGALERAPVTVKMRNVAPVPLGLGAGRYLNSRFFFGPSLETGIRTRSDFAAGEVIDLDRRLRLKPNEGLTVTVWPEVGLVGYLAELGSSEASRLRWRLLQGFEARSAGSRDVGPGCVEVTTATLVREPLPEAKLSPESLAARLQTSNETELPGVLVAIRARMISGSLATPADAALPGLAQAVEQYLPGWSPTVRLLAAAVLPPRTVADSLTKVDALLLADRDESVRLAALVTRVTDPKDPALDAAEQSPALKPVAAHLRARLSEGGTTYSRNGVNAAVEQRSK